jgi:heptosyltransferase III
VPEDIGASRGQSATFFGYHHCVSPFPLPDLPTPVHNKHAPPIRSLESKPPRRVLVLTERRLGDVLLTTPLIHSLRCAWPEAQIDVSVFASCAVMLAANPDIDCVLPFPDRGSYRAQWAFAARLLRNYDIALSTLAGDRPTLLALLAAPYRLGPIDPRKRWRRRLLDAWFEIDLRGTHSVLRHLQLADLLGIERHYQVILAFTDADRSAAKQLLQSLVCDSGYAVLHPTPMFAYKAWTRAGWIALARWLRQRGLGVVLTGAEGAAERTETAAIAAAAAGTIDAAGRLGLGAVAALLAGAKVYAGPDTVVTHMAAALGIPTVALFGPSNPLQFAPWPAGFAGPAAPFALRGSATVGNVTLLQGQGFCVPCLGEGCARHAASLSDCLQHMPAARVIGAVEAALAGAKCDATQRGAALTRSDNAPPSST